MNLFAKSMAVFFIAWIGYAPGAFSSPGVKATISSCFTPGENCTQKIVDVISHAQKTLWIQAYQFTSVPITAAVIAAKRRGVDVRIILDKTQCSKKLDAPAKRLSQANIPVWVDNKVSIAHNKVMIVDNQSLISGSFNFSKAAQVHNAENVLIIDSMPLAKTYAVNWKKRQEASLALKDYVAGKNNHINESRKKLPKLTTWLNKTIGSLAKYHY